LSVAARSLVRTVFMVACLAATALGLNNTYGDDAEVKALAEKAACGSAACSVKMLSESRSAFKQTFSYQTRLVETGKTFHQASVDVECTRAFYLLGDYACVLTSGGLPATAH
jgi:hypothetical protein